MYRVGRISLVVVVLLSLLVVVPLAGAASERADRGPWAPNVSYAIGDTVTYNGLTYRCLQAHTSLTGWEPPNVPALWTPVSGSTNTPSGPTRTPTRTTTPSGPTRTPTRTPTGSGGNCWAAWNASTAYNGGAQVSYNGQNYQAAYWTQGDQPDTHSGPAGSGQPWIPMGSCSGGGVTPSRTPTRTNTPTGPTRTPTRTSTALPPPPPGSRISAPYIDVSPGSGSPIMQLASNGSGNKHYTLAFILGRGCSASWFGVFDLNSAEGNAIGTRINELRAAGGDVVISFGGAAAPELANVCPDASSLQAQYQAVISKYSLRYIDLDIEDFNPTAIDLRNKALKNLEAANPNLRVHYTLGVLPTGLTQAQLDVLNNAKVNGTRVDVVNIMAMDYYQNTQDMGGAAIQAAQATRTQLNSLGFTSTQIGITPMIGTNDSHETFTLEDAQQVINWAKSNGIALVAFWSVGRDNGGCPNGSVSPSCSGIAQSSFQFSSIFRGLEQ